MTSAIEAGRVAHTAGPWSASCNDNDDRTAFWDIEAPRDNGAGYRGTVAMVHSAEHIGGITLAERDANARLIAAAPDLLEALEAYVEAVNNERERRTKHHAQMHAAFDKMRECERVARAAIAKARATS